MLKKLSFFALFMLLASSAFADYYQDERQARALEQMANAERERNFLIQQQYQQQQIDQQTAQQRAQYPYGNTIWGGIAQGVYESRRRQ